MLYDLEQGEVEQKILEQCRSRNLPVPDAIKNAPTLFKGLDFYYRAFWELSTCRVNGFGIGNITYFMCVDYCEINDIINEQRSDFIDVILRLDKEYVKFVNKKNEPQSKKGA